MNTSVDDLLRDCCWSVAESLRKEYMWTTSDTGNHDVETEKDGNFVTTLMGELSWILSDQLMTLLMEAKVQALRAEADVLEMNVHKWHNAVNSEGG